MKKVNFLITGTALLMLSCAQPKAGWGEYKSTFATDFKKTLKSDKTVSASYAVFDRDSIIWNDSYGFANKKASESASVQTRYIIGSITKVFTAVAILQLQEKNKLNIDSCVSYYLPEFAIKQRFPDSRPITIRDVLTHHAGLPTDIFLHKFAERPPRFEEILYYLNQQSTCFPVGKIRSYSNIGYALLGMIIEKVSGTPYTEYVQKNIFAPLAMNNSGFYTSTKQQDILSQAYDIDGVEKEELPIYDVPAGAIYSTVEDMVKFGQSFLNNSSQLLHPQTLKNMFALQNKEIRFDLYDKSAICFTIKNKAQELGRVLEHGGATMYHRGELYLAPDAGIGCVMLSNSPEGVKNAWKLNEQFMVEYTRQHGIKPAANKIPDKTFHFTSIKDKDLRQYTGDYTMPGMNCSMTWKNDHLSVNIQGNSFYLLPGDDHTFVAAKRVLGMMFKSKEYYFFLEEIQGEKLFIRAMPWGGLSIIGKQIKKKAISPDWAKRVGKYEIVNQDKNEFQMINSIEIIHKNGFLVLAYQFNAIANAKDAAEMTLDIADRNTAYIAGTGSGGGESVVFSHKEKQNENTFEYYGLKCRQIKL